MPFPTLLLTRAATRTATRVPGAGTPSLRRRLADTDRTGTVIHAGPHAIYARIAEWSQNPAEWSQIPAEWSQNPAESSRNPAGWSVVGVVTRGAVRVPLAVAVALPVLPDVAIGDRAEVHDGTLYVAGLAMRVDRLTPSGVPRLDAGAAGRLPLPALGGVRRQLPSSALSALAAGEPSAVLVLLGRGDGLTPVGDDVLAGWLAAARAAGRDTTPIADAVRAHPHRTTELSAALLTLAAEGDVIPEFRGLLLALAGGTRAATEQAVARLAAVGHTSGAGMLLGAHLALRAPEVSSR